MSKTKTVYNFDGTQRILDYSDRCPISGRWLVPKKCTDTPPPEIPDGYTPYWDGAKWISVINEQFAAQKRRIEKEAQIKADEEARLKDEEKYRAEIEKQNEEAKKAASETAERIREQMQQAEKEQAERQAELQALKDKIQVLTVEIEAIKKASGIDE